MAFHVETLIRTIILVILTRDITGYPDKTSAEDIPMASSSLKEKINRLLSFYSEDAATDKRTMSAIRPKSVEKSDDGKRALFLPHAIGGITLHDDCDAECAGFDVDLCDASCYRLYKIVTKNDDNYEACLVECAMGYLYCKFTLGCDIDKRR